MLPCHVTRALYVVMLFASTASAQKLEVVYTLPADAAKPCGPCLEGPAVDADGNVYFTNLRGNVIMKMTTDGKVANYRHPANNPNGLAFDPQFRLLAAERGDNAAKVSGRITRTDMKTERIEVLAEISGPNDVTSDARGNVYFSAGGAIHRIDTAGRRSEVVGAPVIDSANGLILSPDDRRLYVVEQNVSSAKQGPRQIRLFDLSLDGTVSNPRVFHKFFPGRGGDGVAIDSQGNLYVAGGVNNPRPETGETGDVKAGVHVFSPDGNLIKMIPVPIDLITNVAFGGRDMKTMYITSGPTLFRIDNDIAGTRR
jgi:gluconolactonase